MINLGSDEMAKYPFLADSGQYLKDKGFTLEQFGADPDLKMMIEKAFERIQVAADGQIYKSELIADSTSQRDRLSADSAGLPLEIFSFLLAVILLKFAGMNALIRKFAMAESRRAEKFLEKDLGDISDKSKEELAIRLIGDLFSVTVSKRDDSFVVPAADYITHSIHFHEKEWKLVNRRVEDGMVYLSPHETIRLIRYELNNYINSKILSTKIPQILPGFEEPVNKLVQLGKKFTPATVTSTEYPPCIKEGIKVLERGENLPHSGRFMLASFLLNRGQSIEQIAPLFKNAPDYNEKITLYQLNQIANASNTGEPYACPSCEKLKSKDLCFATSECDGIINPLQFGRRRS